MRHSAWLDAAPESTGPKGQPAEPQPPRRKQLDPDGDGLEMPHCDAHHLLRYLFDIGPAQSTGMGMAPISHQEILAWQINTGTGLQAWEATYLRRLSAEYISAATEAKRPTCPPPWLEAPYHKQTPQQTAARMRAELRRQAAL